MGRIPHRPGGPWPGILLAASVLGSCLQPAPAQTPVTIGLTPPSPALGGGVSLAPQNPPQDMRSCSWFRSATAAEPSRILTYFPGITTPQNNGPAQTGRETAGPGCVLHIAGLTLNDTGSYTVLILSPTSSGLGSVALPVYEKLAKPTVTSNQNQVPENGTLTLTCNTSPSADTVLWLQNGSSIAPNKRLGLSPDNRTLTVQNFTWGDAGTYQCEVRNPVSTERSEPSTVTLAYAPRPGLPAGAVAGIVIGSLAGAALVGVGAYFLYSRCRNETPKENEAPAPVYENLPRTAGVGPVAQPGSPPDPSPMYQTLQPRQPDVYEELKK